MGTHVGLRTRMTDAWRWLRDGRSGQAVTVLLLLLLAALSPALLFHPVGSRVLGVVLLGLPSLLTLLASVLLATMAVGRGASAVAAGCLLYVGVGALLASLPLGYGYMGSLRRGARLWGLLVWPTVTMLYLGPALDLWPDHAE